MRGKEAHDSYIHRYNTHLKLKQGKYTRDKWVLMDTYAPKFTCVFGRYMDGPIHYVPGKPVWRGKSYFLSTILEAEEWRVGMIWVWVLDNQSWEMGKVAQQGGKQGGKQGVKVSRFSLSLLLLYYIFSTITTKLGFRYFSTSNINFIPRPMKNEETKKKRRKDVKAKTVIHSL